MLHYFARCKFLRHTLEAKEKEKIRTILFIMDHFSISLQGYHELLQVDPSLPQTHLIEGCAKNVDSQWDVMKTLVLCPGAELPIRSLLEKDIHVS